MGNILPLLCIWRMPIFSYSGLKFKQTNLTPLKDQAALLLKSAFIILVDLICPHFLVAQFLLICVEYALHGTRKIFTIGWHLQAVFAPSDITKQFNVNKAETRWEEENGEEKEEENLEVE